MLLAIAAAAWTWFLWCIGGDIIERDFAGLLSALTTGSKYRMPHGTALTVIVFSFATALTVGAAVNETMFSRLRREPAKQQTRAELAEQRAKFVEDQAEYQARLAEEQAQYVREQATREADGYRTFLAEFVGERQEILAEFREVANKVERLARAVEHQNQRQRVPRRKRTQARRKL